MKKIIATCLAVLTVILCVLTVVTYFSSDYIRARDRVQYLKAEKERYLDGEYTTYSPKEMREAKSDLSGFTAKSIALASATGVSLIACVVAVCLIKYSKTNSLAHRKQEEANRNKQNTSNADELEKYKDLYDRGIITEEEFTAKKKQLLGL